MSESLRDLATWYPLLPADGAVPAIARNILDMRVCVEIPVGDLRIHGQRRRIETQGQAMLTAVSPTALTVVVTRGHLDGETGAAPTQTYSVPVFIGRDVVPPATGSYAICAAAPVQETLATAYEVHPNCLLFHQPAPSVSFMERGPVNSNDAQIDPATGTRINGAVNRYPGAAYLPVLSFESGYNVNVSGADSLLAFTGTVGAGKGIWVGSPFHDLPNWNTQPGRGLRSINGQGEIVTFAGANSINVRVHEELDDETNQQTIVVELQPKTSEEIV